MILSLGHEAPPCTYRKLEEKKPLQGSEEIPPSLYCTIHTHMGSQDHLLHRGAWPLCSAVPYTHTHTHTHTHAHTHTHPHTHTQCLYSKSLVSLHHTQLSCENTPICSHSCLVSLLEAPVGNRLLLPFLKNSINYSLIKRFGVFALFCGSVWLTPPVRTAESSENGDVANLAQKRKEHYFRTTLISGDVMS